MSAKETVIFALGTVTADVVGGIAIYYLALLVIFGGRRRTRSLTAVAQQLGFCFRGTDVPHGVKLAVPLVLD